MGVATSPQKLWTLKFEFYMIVTKYYSLFDFFFFFFGFPGLHLWHMEVPRLGVKLEQLQLLAYTTVTATPDPGHIFDIHYDSW